LVVLALSGHNGTEDHARSLAHDERRNGELITVPNL